MRNKKIKLIALSIVIAAANLSGCSKKMSFDEYLVAAKSQVENGDASSAILSLKNAVRLQPKNAESRFELGSLYLSEGDLFSAEKELDKAVELGSQAPYLLPNIAKVKMLLNKFEEVYTLADSSGAYDNERYVMILTYAGLAAIADNKKDAAEDYINQASMLSEESLYSRVGSAWLNFSNENYKEVSQTLDNILQQSDKFPEALLLSGHLHQTLYQYDKAVEKYSLYLEQHPRQFQVKLYLINSLLAAKKYEQAEKHVVLLNKIYKDHPLVSLYNAQVQYNKGDFLEAKLNAEKAVSHDGTMYMGQMIAGMSAFRLNELELAYSYLNKVGPLLPTNHDVKKLLAMLQFQLGFDDEAQLSFESMDATNVNDIDILTAASRAFSTKGQHGVAENLLDKVVKAHPENKDLALQYSALKLKNGDEGQLDLLEQLAKSDNKSADAPMILATYYINEKDYKNAFRIAKEWQSTEAGNIKGQLLEGFIYVNKKEISTAKKIFEQVLEQDKGNIPANYYLGEFAFDQKLWAKSKLFFLEILSFEPTHKASVARLSFINNRLGKQNETIDYLNELLVKHPNNQEIIIDLAINLNTAGKLAESIALLERVDIPDKSTRFNKTLAKLYIKDTKLEKAKKIYESLVKSEPPQYDIWLEYASVDRMLGNVESALTIINKALNVVDKQENLLSLKAELLLSLNRDESAATIINPLFEQYPNHKYVTYLKGQLNLRQGKSIEASKQFSMLYSTDPSNKLALQWAQAELKTENDEKAINIIEKHEQMFSLNAANKAFLAELLLEKNPTKSKALYLELNELYPANVAVLNNLSLALYNLNEFKEALPHAEAAYKLTQSTITIDTYSKMLLANTLANKAVALINDDDNKMFIDENLRLTLVESYISLNKYIEAREVLNKFDSIPHDLSARYNKLSEQLD